MITDFGEKIGGSRKDLWKKRYFIKSDLDNLTDEDAFIFCIKDKIWPKPNYKDLCKDKSKLIVFCIKKLRDALPATVKPTTDIQKNKLNRKLFVEFISLVRDNIMNLTDEEDLKHLFYNIFVKNGYYKSGWTNKVYLNKNIKNKFIKNVFKISNYLDDIKKELENSEFPESLTFVIKELRPGKFYICKNNKYYRRVFEKSFSNKEQARKYMLTHNNTKKISFFKFKKPELKNIKRKCAYFRNSNVSTYEMANIFGFRAGEFGNYANEVERQMHINYCFEAFIDLAYILNINPKFISLTRKNEKSIAIAFGARGGGSASAHYEPYRKVINLTKIHGPGCLAHEWMHALDHFIGDLCGNTSMNPFASRHISDTSKISSDLLKSFKDLLHSLIYKKMTKSELNKYIKLCVSGNKNSLNRNIKTIRQYLLKEQLYNSEKRSRIATKSEMDYFDNLAQDVLKNNTSPDKLFDLFKCIKGQLPNSFLRESINTSINNINSFTNSKNRYSEIFSDFYLNSKKLDGKRKKPYYSNIAEMLARAFESYIANKLKDIGYISQYLVYSVDNRGYKGFNPYPESKEIKKISKSFDEFFSELKKFLFISDYTFQNSNHISESISQIDWDTNQNKALIGRQLNFL